MSRKQKIKTKLTEELEQRVYQKIAYDKFKKFYRNPTGNTITKRTVELANEFVNSKSEIKVDYFSLLEKIGIKF